MVDSRPSKLKVGQRNTRENKREGGGGDTDRRGGDVGVKKEFHRMKGKISARERQTQKQKKSRGSWGEKKIKEKSKTKR